MQYGPLSSTQAFIIGHQYVPHIAKDIHEGKLATVKNPRCIPTDAKDCSIPSSKNFKLQQLTSSLSELQEIRKIVWVFCVYDLF